MDLLKNPDFTQPVILFGGSFDPVHNGHLHIAEACLKKMPQVKQFVFVPCYANPWKHENLATPIQRLFFLTEVLLGTPYKIWDFELKQENPSFTIHTLEEAKRRGAKCEQTFWLIGADSYRNLLQWKEGERLRDYCRFLVVNRPQTTFNLHSEDDIFLNIPSNSCSSTEIRDALALGNIPKHCLHPKLAALFEELSLKSQNPYAMQCTTYDT